MSIIFCRKIPAWLYGICILAMAAAAVLLLCRIPPMPVTAAGLVGKCIVLDAGHGGFDPGVLGCRGTREADINLAVMKQLARFLHEGGAEVVVLRESDRALAGDKAGDLARRVQLAEESGADIYISLHCNAFGTDSQWHGAQCFYHSRNEESKLLAESIQSSLIAALGNTERTALAHDSTYILKHLTMPAVITEMGFLSNREEEALLLDPEYQARFALAIYAAICGYFSQ